MLKLKMNKKNFAEIILQKSKSNPNKVILKDRWKNWTWQNLLLRSFAYAEFIQKNFHHKNASAVPILVGRSGESVAAILGTILIGYTFTPISHNQPSSRIKNILNSLNSDKIILGLHSSEKKPQKLKSLELSESKLSKKYNKKPKKNNILYLLFTSGSTGKPKGVLCSTQNILNTLIWSKYYLNWKKTDVIGCATQFSFDISLFDFFTMLYYDVPLAILDNVSNPDETLQQISNFNVTSIFSVPAFFSQFTSEKFIKNISKTKLRRIIAGGDFFPPKHTNFWLKNFSKISIYNVWGPTETSIVNTMHNITKRDFNKIRKGDYTSIGKSHPLMQLVLLNIKNKLISKSNEVGELVMLGKSVSMGYFDDSVETKKKYFIFDGKPAFKTGDIGYRDKNNNFYILGRNDNLVKIHGYRIDLNEIEKTISYLPNVYTTSVFVNKISSDHNELWAATELEKKDKKLNIFEIKKKLRKLLPNYMVPKRLFTIPKIPLTSNGKLDKKKLLKYINQNLT